MKTKQFWMKTMVILLGFSILAGCTKEAVTTNTTNNSEFEVEELFTNKQCTVYRFYDNGDSHYYTDCSEVISRESYLCGKSRCSKSVSIKTKEN